MNDTPLLGEQVGLHVDIGWPRTRNTTNTGADGIALGVEYPGERASNGNAVAPSVSAQRLLVNLNANDTLRVVGYQRNYGGQTKGLDDGSTSLTFEVEWNDEL